MDIIARYVHGSEDSTDLDVIYVTNIIPEMAECVPFCNEDPNENRNLATVENGIISWSFKGFSDEVNNALLDTYPLHAQEYDLLVEHSVPRDLPVKLLSVLRKSVMELRHTTLRSAARSALRRGYDARLEMLRETDLRCLEWTVTEQQLLDRMKTLAFQFGQAIALYEGAELFTKSEIADYLPSLRPYLYRETCQPDGMEEIKYRFIDAVTAQGFRDCGNMTVMVPGDPDRYIGLRGKEQDVT
jgi:hypothetical protein